MVAEGPAFGGRDYARIRRMRRDLKAALDGFVASHPGLRAGRVFGSPAAFAGRRMFARLLVDGLQLRLPASVRPSTRAQSAKREGRRPVLPPSDWLTITPSSRDAARLEILLEQSARYVATS